MLIEKRQFQSKYKKAGVQKCLEEIDKQRQQSRQEKTITKQVKEVKEEEEDTNTAPREEEAVFVRHLVCDRKDRAREEQHVREEFRGSPPQSKRKATETRGAREGRERHNKKQPRKVGAAPTETTAGAGSQCTSGDLEVGQGVQLVGMKQGDLEGCMGNN